MPSERFEQRLKQMQELRAPPPPRAHHSVVQRLSALAIAISFSSLFFLVLKGMTLAYFGPEGFADLTAALGPEARPGGLNLWISGPDPVSRTIADIIAPAFVRL